MTSDDSQMRFGVISEIHLAPKGTPATGWHNPFWPDQGLDLLLLAVGKLRTLAINCCVVLGDLSHLGDHASIRRVANALSTLGVECWILPGNHDVDDEDDALERFADAVGSPGNIVAPAGPIPVHGFSAHLLALYRTVNPPGFVSVGFSEEMQTDDGLALVFSHFPILSMTRLLKEANLKHAGDLDDRKTLEGSLTARTAPTVAVHGHLHVRASMAAGSLLHLSCAALIEPPHEVTILEVGLDGDARMLVSRQAQSIRHSEAALPVLSPATETWLYDSGAWVSRR